MNFGLKNSLHEVFDVLLVDFGVLTTLLAVLVLFLLTRHLHKL